MQEVKSSKESPRLFVRSHAMRQVYLSTISDRPKSGWWLLSGRKHFFHCKFQPQKINLAENGQLFSDHQAQGKLAQDGQMLYNCWAISLIATLLLTFMSHIRHTTKYLDT